MTADKLVGFLSQGPAPETPLSDDMIGSVLGLMFFICVRSLRQSAFYTG